MVIFEDIQDIEDWLDPLDYAAFWDAVEPWEIFEGGTRAHCDQTIAKRITSEDTVLTCIKASARLELTVRFGLKDRIYEPADAKYLNRVH